MTTAHSERSLGVARRGIANGIAIALLAAFGTGNALAFQLDTSYNPDLSVRLDTTVRVNYAVRTESRDNKIGNDVIADEGDYSFDKVGAFEGTAENGAYAYEVKYLWDWAASCTLWI